MDIVKIIQHATILLELVQKDVPLVIVFQNVQKVSTIQSLYKYCVLPCAKHNILSKDVTNQKLARYQKWFIRSKNMILKIERLPMIAYKRSIL